MKGDFTRDTFDASKHFSRVLMQQGRVQLDADWNEQAAILLHYLQSLAADLIGPHGGPANADGAVGNGFKIDVAKDDSGAAINNDFAILKGHYYVAGLLCENDAELAPYTHYTNQVDYPLADDAILKDGTYLVYLDVWERHITSLEDDYIREQALGGPDTATRAKVVWQVKTWPVTNNVNNLVSSLKDAAKYQSTWLQYVEKWQPAQRGRLQAMVKPVDGDITDPCITPPQSGYRGAENQLYRVEIHSGGRTGQATFKWSRDNGSVVAEWKGKQGNDLIVGRGRGFAAGQWVELIDDTRELRGERGPLVKLVKVEDEVLTIDPNSTQESTDWLSTFINPKVRRWDQQETADIKLSDNDNAIPIQEDGPIDLEDGIQIRFSYPTANGFNQYRTGDYWLIPARTATGNVEWPMEEPLARGPRGVMHHYAPLWIISVTQGGIVSIDPANDLRRNIKPLPLF